GIHRARRGLVQSFVSDLPAPDRRTVYDEPPVCGETQAQVRVNGLIPVFSPSDENRIAQPTKPRPRSEDAGGERPASGVDSGNPWAAAAVGARAGLPHARSHHPRTAGLAGFGESRI